MYKKGEKGINSLLQTQNKIRDENKQRTKKIKVHNLA